MHYFRRYIAVFIAIFFLFSSLVFGETLILAADEWCPINCTPKSNNEGIFIDIARKIFEPQGIKIDYIVIPWSRAISDTRLGKYDAIVGAYENEAQDFISSKSIMPTGESLYVLNENPWKYAGIESLIDISIGVVQNYEYSDEINKYIMQNIKNSKRVQATSGDNPVLINIKKLFAKRIDAVLENDIVFQYMVSKGGQSDKVKSVVSFPKQDLFIKFSPNNKNSAKYSSILSDGIDTLHANGEFDAIMKKYNVQ